MARQDSIFHFRGKLGNVVGVRTKTGFYIRSLPKVNPESRQKGPNYEPCRKAAGRFGQNATLATYIRHSLAEHLELMADGALNNRLVSTLTSARQRCMKGDMEAPLDIRKAAPAFRRFSLRQDFCLNDIEICEPKLLPPDEEGNRILHLPKLIPDKTRFRKVNPEIVRWHIALIPLPHTADQPFQAENTFLETQWMPIEAIEEIQLPLSKEIFQANADHDQPVPVLIAIGYEAAQGNPDNPYPFRTLSVMEILEIA